MKIKLSLLLLLSILLICGTGLIVGYAQTEDAQTLTPIPDLEKVNQEFLNIDLFQYESKLDTDKYTFIPTYEKDNIEYTIHEYQTPDGKIGYQTFVDDGINIISIATGIESNERTWTKLKKDLILPTSVSE